MTNPCQPASHGSSLPSADIDTLGLLGAIIGELGEVAMSMALNIESSDTINSIVAPTEALRCATKALQQAIDKLRDQSGAA
jgi:hypothetical protein